MPPTDFAFIEAQWGTNSLCFCGLHHHSYRLVLNTWFSKVDSHLSEATLTTNGTTVGIRGASLGSGMA